MLIDLHGIAVACESPDEVIRERWAQSFASRPQVASRAADITFTLSLVRDVLPAPAVPAIYAQGDLLTIYQTTASRAGAFAPASRSDAARDIPSNNQTTIHFPRFGQLRVQFTASRVDGDITETALGTYGAFEDIVAMGLTALLRRRHLFLIHAFSAAAPSPATRGTLGGGVALLLVGDIGSGKTTTGISLLRAGWKLLSNDSPLLSNKGQGASDKSVVALAYPGLLSAYADTLQRFPELASLTPAPPHPRSPSAASSTRQKITFAAESIYPDVWIESAPVRAVIFPRVAHRAEHVVTPLSATDALRRLLPNAIDRWDSEMIPEHLQLLTALVAQAPAYQLELGEEVEALPALLQSLLSSGQV